MTPFYPTYVGSNTQPTPGQWFRDGDCVVIVTSVIRFRHPHDVHIKTKLIRKYRRLVSAALKGKG
jgi:hypothetical protein